MSYTDGYVAGDMRSEREAAQQLTPAELWLKKIEKRKGCKKREAWMRDARNAVSLYEEGAVKASTDGIDIDETLSGANLWHSNIETAVPALFNSVPIPDARIRYGDPDPVQRAVCEITERGISFDFDQYDFADVIKDLVRQSEMTGWGIPRLRYRPQVQTVEQDAGADGDTSPNSYEQLVRDDVEIEVAEWDRLILGEAKSWQRLPWLAFEWDMTLDEIDDLVPPTIDKESGKEVLASDQLKPQTNRDDDSGRKDTEPAQDDALIFGTVKVYEVWDKRSRKVLFITPQDKKNVLRETDDPFELDGFYPIPKILYSKRRINGLQPISPWTTYKSLFQQFEGISLRIRALVGQIKVRGLYDKELEADFELLKTCKDGEYVSAKVPGVFAGGKGLEAAIAHWPLQELVVALEKAVLHQERLKQQIFEETGLADIMRGAVDPREKLGQSKLKAQWGSLRVQDVQEDIAEMCRAICRMKAEVRARLTPWPLMQEITGVRFDPQVPEPPQPTGDAMQDQQAMQQYQAAADQAKQDAQQMEQAVVEAWKSRSRAMRIDIEIDSTIRADLSRDQEQIGQFVQFCGTFMQGAMAAIQVMPETRQPLFKVFVAAASKFKLGRQAEEAFDELVEAAKAPPQLQGAAPADPQQQAHEQQMQQAQASQEQQAQQHEASQQASQQAHEQTIAQHDAMTQQTALEQIKLKDQAAQNQHVRSLELMQMQRAMPPVNGAMPDLPPGGMN